MRNTSFRVQDVCQVNISGDWCVSIYIRLGISIDFLFKIAYKLVKSRIMYLSAILSNWHFKCNSLGKMIVPGNRCINLCPEKYILSQIPIACYKICSEQLKCFPVSSSTMSLGSSNPNFSQDRLILGRKETNLKNHQFVTKCSRDPQWVLMKAYFRYLSKQI